MKSNIEIVSYAFAAITIAVFTAQGQPARSFNEPITSAEQAAAVPKGTNVAMACSKCKTVQVAEVDREKSFLSWFQPKTKHVCPGCGGTWQYVNVAKGTRGGYVHTCSKCGDIDWSQQKLKGKV
jgi:hypothetical protein